MNPFAQLVKSFRLGCHLDADDIQLYLLLDRCLDTTMVNLAAGLEAGVGWLKKRRLRLNQQRWSFCGGGVLTAQFIKSQCDPGCLQVTNIAKMAFFHIRQVGQLAPLLSLPTLPQ